jgi:hypothetical protein
MNMKPHEWEEYVQRFQEHPTFHETCRFLEHEIARTLPRIYPDWYNASIACGLVRICRIDSSYDYFLTPDLWSPTVDIYAQLALHKLDFDTPCHTAGDIADGKLNVISAESIRQYGKSHKNQILEWLSAKQFDRMFVNEGLVARVKAVARGHNGGGV